MNETNDEEIEREKALKKFLCFLYVANDTPHYVAKGRNDAYYYAEGKHMKSVEILASNKKTELVPLDKIKLAMDSGLVRKPKTLMFALAMCARQKKSEKLRESAYYFLTEHCKDWNSFALFIKYASYLCRLEPNESNKDKGKIGWGRGWKNAVNKWYTNQDATDLAILVGRHRASYGWSHKNILKLSHPDLDSLDTEKQVVFKYVLDGLSATTKEFAKDETAAKQLAYLRSVEEFRRCNNPRIVVERLSEGFTIDHVHPTALRSREVWKHLLAKTDVRTILKYLPKLSQRGFLMRDSRLTEPLIRSLTDPNNLQWNKILPLDILAVLNLYEQAPRRTYNGRSKLNNVEYDDTHVEKLTLTVDDALTPEAKWLFETMLMEAKAKDEQNEKERKEKLKKTKDSAKKKNKRRKLSASKNEKVKDAQKEEDSTVKKQKPKAPRKAPNKKIREALLRALNISRTIDITGSSERTYVISIRRPSLTGHACIDAGLPLALPLLHRAPSSQTYIFCSSPLTNAFFMPFITEDTSYDEAFRIFLDKVPEKRADWKLMPEGLMRIVRDVGIKCDVFIDVQCEPPSKKNFHAIRKMKEHENLRHTRIINWVVNRGTFELKGDYWQEVLTIHGRDPNVPFIIEAYARGLF